MSVLIGGVQAVTMDPSLGIVDRCDILIGDNGRILDVAESPSPMPEGVTDVLDGDGLIAIPGLIDTHRHAWLELFRGLTADMTVRDYRQLTKSGLAEHVTPEAVRLATLVGDLVALEAGITTVADLAHIGRTRDHLEASVQGHQDSEIRAVLAHTPPNGDSKNWYAASERRHPREIRWLRDILHGDDALVTLAMGARPRHCVAQGVMEDDVAVARELGVRLIYDGIGAATGGGGEVSRWSHEDHRTIAGLVRSGLLGPDMGFVHGNHLTEDELALIADHGAGLSVAPEVEMLSGYGLPVFGRDLVQPGLTLALSTDVATYVAPSLLSAMRTMLMLARGRAASRAYDLQRDEPPLVPALSALGAATTAAARFLGLERRIGSLSPGKDADVTLVDRRGVHLSGVRDPVAAVVLFAHAGDVRHVLVRGRILKRDHAIAHAGLAGLAGELGELGSRILDQHRVRRGDEASPTWNF
ncbi:amidohydrolase family protein [Prauserella muralis]|uniref:Uncharacterized protein n=1 Tax=Prauserella muralis TaxID=588067 RepID=A0A2V4AUH9_9PSEU|nr:amidohydrolase family protein [Prauserella muralis]PXY24679.1 hypothetical protein BAY60_19415 [Prauserella muralis]TWE27629.1 cytosine/adenosine deaminase-related metal-dependent hydrolase [Prauserella muralis]